MNFAIMLCVVAIVLTQGCAVYNTTADGAHHDLMLLGHDPVSYFSGASPVPGKADLNARHRHGTYRFATAENRERFLADPARFAPRYGGFCAKGVSYAVRAGGDPLVYEIRGDRLFIFVNDYARDYWRTDPRDFIDKADFYWESELAEAPVKWTNLKRFFFRVPHYKSYPEEFADYERRTGKPAPERR
ncbi:MAG: YHS domain-containing (seleno)protein [Burkholderiales bacterium]